MVFLGSEHEQLLTGSPSCPLRPWRIEMDNINKRLINMADYIFNMVVQLWDTYGQCILPRLSRWPWDPSRPVGPPGSRLPRWRSCLRAAGRARGPGRTRQTTKTWVPTLPFWSLANWALAQNMCIIQKQRKKRYNVSLGTGLHFITQSLDWITWTEISGSIPGPKFKRHKCNDVWKWHFFILLTSPDRSPSSSASCPVTRDCQHI